MSDKAHTSKAKQRLEQFRVGETRHGFRLEKSAWLDRMAVAALLFKHDKSGARLLHLAADDPENLFSVAFRTPPPDDTGLPHILEHSVLCGSRNYPVKDPFVELLKTSLATFLNASTYPDRTLYPCASMNHKDFINLMRVYADAAFFPTLSADRLRQEGHHLVFGPDGKPGIKGVVYNEMRGAYSSPDGILEKHLQELLFESNAYGLDYGGDPKCIPNLTFDQYLKFHQKYYHPANAWIFTYGDADPETTLEVLDNEYLREFDAIAVDTAIAPLARWDAPRAKTFSYPIDANDDPTCQTDVAIAWATNDRRDIIQTLCMHVAEIYLLDNAASPLRKALIDSKLGQELGNSGYADHQRDTFFLVTLKGSEADRADAVEKLVLDVLRAECDNGFDHERVESALHSMELASREIRPQYPLRLMERAYASWIYDADPLEQINLSERLDQLCQALSDNPKLLEQTVRTWLVDNPHRLRLTLTPDKGYIEKLDADTAADIEARLAGMSVTEIEEAKHAATRLEQEQSQGNSPEALATLPRLAIRDISPDPIPLEVEKRQIAGQAGSEIDLLDVQVYTGGIGYFNMNLDLSGLDEADLDMLPLLCEAIGKSGAAGLDYAAMADREAAATGALEFSAGMRHHIDGDKSRLRMSVWLKALEPDWKKALDILGDRLFKADFADRDRLRDIVLQSRMVWRNDIVPSGHAYAALHAAANLSPALALSERLGGAAQARMMDRFANALDSHINALPDRLVQLRDKVLAGASASASFAGGGEVAAISQDWLGTNAAKFGGTGAHQPLPPIDQPTNTPRIGLAAPSDVAYAAQAMPAPALTDPLAPALLLLGGQLSYGHLWNEIRVKGGAYGIRATFDGARRLFTLASYRDPNVMRTLEIYAKVADFVENEMDLSGNGLEQAKIGTFKTLDQPVRPSWAVATALARHLGGEDETFRRKFRKSLLGLDADTVKQAAATVLAQAKSAPTCVIASREKLQDENGSVPEPERLDIQPLWLGGGNA